MNPIRPPSATGGDSTPVYSDEETQEALVEWLEAQEYWKRNNGRDHVIVASDPNAMYRVVDKVKNSILLVSDFGRLRPDQGSLVKDVILPYSHRINTYTGQISVENRDTLLFFMGNRYRKEVIPIILLTLHVCVDDFFVVGICSPFIMSLLLDCLSFPS